MCKRRFDSTRRLVENPPPKRTVAGGVKEVLQNEGEGVRREGGLKSL